MSVVLNGKKFVLILLFGIDIGVFGWNYKGWIDMIILVMINFKIKIMILMSLLCDFEVVVFGFEQDFLIKLNVVYVYGSVGMIIKIV